MGAELARPLAWVAQKSWPRWLGCWRALSYWPTWKSETCPSPGQHGKAGPTTCWCYWWESWSCPLSGQCGRTDLGGKTVEGQPLWHGHGRAGPSSCKEEFRCWRAGPTPCLGRGDAGSGIMNEENLTDQFNYNLGPDLAFWPTPASSPLRKHWCM